MMISGSGYMSASDAFAWHMERDAVLRSPVVAIDWLDCAPDWDVLLGRVDRISRLMPSLRQRVVESPFRLTAPRWTYDPHFDLNWHLTRIGASPPGTRDAVLQLARRAAMADFDRARPLWEVTLVEGLEGGEAALVVKFHHSLSDGAAAMRMLAIVADQQREPRDLGEMPPVPPPEIPGLPGLIAGAVGEMAGQTASLARRGVGEAIGYVRDPIGYVRGAGAMACSVYRTAAPSRSTLSPLMRERATTRYLAMTEVPLDALKKMAKTAGGTVNDAFLAAVAGGLGRYHERHGAAVGSMRALMPISLRAGSNADWGNRITLQRLTVPVGEPDPVARVRELHRVAKAAREEPSLSVTEDIAAALNVLPVDYVGGILKHVDFVASNVPGPPVPVYLAGGRVTGFFTFGPTIGASLNITMLSYDGTCDIGINIDTAAVPDPDVMVACLRESFAEIAALGQAAGRRRVSTGGRAARPERGSGRTSRTA
jgi:diacylglycerol O-acyltransferase / wax synthase